jgi:hypothetical protein
MFLVQGYNQHLSPKAKTAHKENGSHRKAPASRASVSRAEVCRTGRRLTSGSSRP